MLSAMVSVRMMTAQSRCAATASSASAALGAQATVCPDTPARRNPRTVSSSAMLNYFTAQPRFFAATSWRRRNQARPVLPLGIIRMKYLGREAKERMLDMPYGKKGEVYYFAQMVGYQIPGKALRVRVDNIPRSLTYTGYWTYVREGKEITIPINDHTNQFKEGWGDYVKNCFVQRTSTYEIPGFAPFFQYQITKGQITNRFVGTHQFTEEVPVVIFESGQITDEKPVIYQRK